MEKQQIIQHLVRVRVQLDGMVLLQQGPSTIIVPNVCSLMHDLIKTNYTCQCMRKWNLTASSPFNRHKEDDPEKGTRNIKIDEISYQPEKIYASALMKILAKDIAHEIFATIKNNCKGCIYMTHNELDHGTCKHLPSEKTKAFFDIAFRKMDMYSANDECFEKVKDQIAIAVRNSDLYLTRKELLRNETWIEKLKTQVTLLLTIM